MSSSHSPMLPDAGEEPRLKYVCCASPTGLHRMAYWEWGDPDNDHVLLCVHGLTRTGRDFDPLARTLSSRYRVVCPDVVGRGRSDWLADAASYVVPQYVADMVALIDRLNPTRLDWLGTSMGGLIGLGLVGMMMVSAARRPDRGDQGLGGGPDIPLRRMVFNDVGPALDADGLRRIATYVGQDVRFDTFAEAVAYVQSVSEGFGPHDAAGWVALTQDVFREQAGQWVKHYDLRLAEPFALQTPALLDLAEQQLWQAWDLLPVPALVLRGAHSDILSAADARLMCSRNTKARCVEIPGVGHAPTLRSDDQIRIVADFLAA